MKRTIVQMSLMAVAVLVIAVAANAQSSQVYRANIPFDFEAVGKNNSAGKYILAPVSGALSIRNHDSGKARLLGMIQVAGDGNWDKPGKLTFVKSAGKYTLSEISTATFKMKMRRTRTDVREVSGGKAAAEEVVTIYLN